MIKKLLPLIFCATFIFIIPVFGESTKVPIDIRINNEYILSNNDPFIIDGTCFVPVRLLGETLGCTVEWDNIYKTVTLYNHDTVIKLSVGDDFATVNDKKHQLSKGIIFQNSTIFVPVRFISEVLNCKVSWNWQYYTVEISKDNILIPPHIIDTRYTYDDLYWLSRIIYAESGAEPLEGQIAVGNVVLNRVSDNNFPNDIKGVIFDDKYGVQFQPVSNGSIYNTPSDKSIIAAKKSLRGERPVGSCLYFLNPKIATSFWITQNRDFFTSINNHDFYI